MVQQFDDEMRRRVGSNENLSVPWILSAYYSYHFLNNPILSDGAFDWLCDILDRNWEGIHHFHKSLIGRCELKSRSLSIAESDLPNRTKGATQRLQPKDC